MKKLNNSGQALVEYVLIIAIITAFAVVAINLLGGRIKDSLTKTSCSVMGQAYEDGKEPGEGRCIDVESKEVIGG